MICCCILSLYNVVAQGAKRDVLVILMANALIIPLCKRVGLSPVLGFLAAGVVLGPNCLSVVSDVKAIEVRHSCRRVVSSNSPLVATDNSRFAGACVPCYSFLFQDDAKRGREC